MEHKIGLRRKKWQQLKPIGFIEGPVSAAREAIGREKRNLFQSVILKFEIESYGFSAQKELLLAHFNALQLNDIFSWARVEDMLFGWAETIFCSAETEAFISSA